MGHPGRPGRVIDPPPEAQRRGPIFGLLGGFGLSTQLHPIDRTKHPQEHQQTEPAGQRQPPGPGWKPKPVT